jgi:voltage-gated potassium channel
MGKIEVPASKLLQRLSAGLMGLVLLIIFSGLIIASDQDLTRNEGMMTSLSIATHIEAETLENSQIASKIMYVFLAFAGEVLAFYVFYVFIEFILSGEMNKKLGGVKDITLMKNMKNHYIVCGGGRVGEHLAEKLKKEGKSLVILDKDELKVSSLKSKGYHALLGASNDEDSLKNAGIKNAHALAAVVGDDGDNLLTILTAKEFNPDISIAARANDENIVSKLKHAGAEVVILPEVVGGMKLADAILGDIDHGHVIHHPENSTKKKSK